MSLLSTLTTYADPHDGLTIHQIPAHIRAINSAQIISMLAAILHAKKSPYYTRTRTPNNNAIARAHYLATLSMFYDFDDFMFAGHTGHSSVLLPLVLAQDFPVSGAEFLCLQTLGNEIGGRLGASLFFGPHNGQMWSSIHQLNAGVIAGRLQAATAVNPQQVLRDTLTRAMAHPIFALFDSFFSSSAKIHTASASLAAGLTAALSAEGVPGPDFMHEEADFYRTFSYAPLMQVWRDLAERWYSQSISIKKYPGCAYIGGPVEACRNIFAQLRERNLSAQDVMAVTIECNMLSKKMNDLSQPYLKGAESSLTTLNFSLPVNCATILLDGDITPESFSAQALARNELWQLAGRVNVEHDLEATRVMMKYSSLLKDSTAIMLKNLHRLGPYMQRMGGFMDAFQIPLEAGMNLFRKSRYPTERLVSPDEDYERFTFVNPAFVTVKLANGEKMSAQSLYPAGFAGTPADEMRMTVRNKLVASGAAEATVRKIIDFSENLAALTNVQVREFSAWFMQQAARA